MFISLMQYLVHVINIPRNAMFHWNFQKYSVNVLYAIID